MFIWSYPIFEKQSFKEIWTESFMPFLCSKCFLETPFYLGCTMKNSNFLLWTLAHPCGPAYLSVWPHLPCHTPYLFPCTSDSSNKKQLVLLVTGCILSWSVTLRTYAWQSKTPSSSSYPMFKPPLLCKIPTNLQCSYILPPWSLSSLFRKLQISCNFSKVHVLSYNSFPLLKLFLCFLFPPINWVLQQPKGRHQPYLPFFS